MQRMLPPDTPRPAPSTSQNTSRPISDTLRDGHVAPNTQPVPADTRAFEYRFSKKYLSSLPEGQRPLERDVFGERDRSVCAYSLLTRGFAFVRSFPSTDPNVVAGDGSLWWTRLREYRGQGEGSDSWGMGNMARHCDAQAGDKLLRLYWRDVTAARELPWLYLGP